MQLIDPLVRAVDGFAGERVSMRVSYNLNFLCLTISPFDYYSVNVRKLDFTVLILLVAASYK